MSKIITLVRHGNYSGSQLTELGKEQAGDVAAQIVQANAVPEAIICSPVTRARETAAILKAAFNAAAGGDVPLKIFPWLHCDEYARASDLAGFDRDPALNNAVRVMVVSHQPQIEMLSRDFNQQFSPCHVEARAFEVDGQLWAALDFKKAKSLAVYRPAKYSR